MTSSRPIPVLAFVDWNSTIHEAKPGSGDCKFVAQRTLQFVGRTLGRVLQSIDSKTRFDVSLRLYHGWHKGFERTDNLRALTAVAAGTDFQSLSSRPHVLIRPDISYGDRLLTALLSRLHFRLGIHLPNTLRHKITDPNDYEEKMVDTAIAADIVDLAHREPETWIIVMGSDDDLVPPIFTAEGVRATRGGRVLLVRRRQMGPFLNLNGILELL